MAMDQKPTDRFDMFRSTPMPNGVRPLVMVETVAKEPMHEEESRIVTYAIFVPGAGNVVGQRLDVSPVRFASINNVNVLDVPSIEAASQLALLRTRLYLDALAVQYHLETGGPFVPAALEKLPEDELRVLAMMQAYGPAWEQFRTRATGEKLPQMMKKCVKWRDQWFASEVAALPQDAVQNAHGPS